MISAPCDEGRQLADMRRSGAIEATVAGARVEKLAKKIANTISASTRLQTFDYPQFCHPLATAHSILIRRDKPLQMTLLPGGPSLALAR